MLETSFNISLQSVSRMNPVQISENNFEDLLDNLGQILEKDFPIKGQIAAPQY